MSRTGDYIIDIQDAISDGKLTFTEIAKKFSTSVESVSAIADMIEDYFNYINAANILKAEDVGCEFDPKVQ